MPPPSESTTPTKTPTPTGTSPLGTIEPLVLTLALGITSVFAFMILICLFKLRTTWRTIQRDPRIPDTRSTTASRMPHSSSARLYAAYTPRSVSSSPGSSGSGLSFSTRTVVSPHPILGERPEDVKVHNMREEKSGSRGSGSFPRKQPTLAAQEPSSALALIDPDATMTEPNANSGGKRSTAETPPSSSNSSSAKLSHSFSSGRKPPKSASSASSGFRQLLSESLPATIAKGILSDTEKALRAARVKSSSSGSLNTSTSSTSSSESSNESVLVMTPAGSLEITIDQAHIPPAPDGSSSAKRKAMGERARSASSASVNRQQAQLGDGSQVNTSKFLAAPDPTKVMKYSKSTTASDQPSGSPSSGRPRSATASRGGGSNNPNVTQQQYIQQMLAHYRSALESCLGKQDYTSIWQPPETVTMDTDTLLAKDGYRTVYEGTMLRPAMPVLVYCYDAVTAAKLAMRATGSAGRHNRRKSLRSRQGSMSPVGSKPARPSPLALSMSMGDMDADESESETEASSSVGGGGPAWKDVQVVEMWIEEIKMLRLVKDCPFILTLLGISLQPSLSNGGHIYHLSLTPRAKPLADHVFNPQAAWFDDDTATIIYQIALALSYVHARGLKGHGAFSILDVHLLPKLATSASNYSFTSASDPSSQTAAPPSTSFPYRAVIGGFGIPLNSAIRRATSLSTGTDRSRGHAYARYLNPSALALGTGSSPIHASPTQPPDAASLADRYALGVLMYECLLRAPVLANVPAPVSVLVAAAKGKRTVVDVRQVLTGACAREGAAGEGEARRVRVKMVELLTRCWAHEQARRPEWEVILQELREVVPQRAAEGWDWR